MSERVDELRATAPTTELRETVATVDARRGASTPRGLLIGRYVVISQLGTGAMGMVFAAFDPELDRKVALKLLKHRGGDLGKSRKRLQREAQSLAKLDHPNVVAVYDVGVHEGQLFVAMEFVEGQTLGEWIAASESPRPWPEVLDVFSAAGRGLAAAHAVGLVHRDFKPDNVMLSNEGEVHVMDFGLARGERSEITNNSDDSLLDVRQSVEKLTQTGTMLGSPAYMSLEQFEAEEVDARSDQFGFCASLYEALYGERPFAGETIADLLRALDREQIQPVPEGTRVPGWLREVIVRGLAKDPAARFESMEALLEALAADPVAARRRWMLRGAAVLAVVAGVWGLAKLWMEVEEQSAVIAVKDEELERQNARLREEKRAAELARDRAQVASLMAGARELAARRQFDMAATLLVMVPEPQQVRGWTQLALDVLAHPMPTLTLTHDGPVNAALWSPDGRSILTASADHTAQVWSPDGSEPTLELEGHTSPVNHAAWSPDGRRILTASADKTIRVWQVDGSAAPVVLEGHMGTVHHAAWSPDGRRIVSASGDGSARVWNADGSGEPAVLEGHEGWVVHAAWSPDGQRIVTASHDGSARVWSEGGSSEPVVLDGHEGPVVQAAWSSDGRRIVTASHDDSARVWSADGSGAALVLDGHTNPVEHATFSPDDRYILTASHDGTARIWTADGFGEPTTLASHADAVVYATWSPDGQRVLTVSSDDSARVWDVDAPADPIAFEGHLADVVHASWSPDGRRIVTASADASARVWEASGPSEPVGLEAHTVQAALKQVISACLTPKQRQDHLAEARDEALAGYHQCERDQGRRSFGGDLSVSLREVELDATTPREDLGARLRVVFRRPDFIHDVERCYRAALTTNTGLAGRLALDFVVEREGDIHSATVNTQQSELAETNPGACVARALERRTIVWLDTHPPAGPLAATVTYDLSWQ